MAEAAKRSSWIPSMPSSLTTKKQPKPNVAPTEQDYQLAEDTLNNICSDQNIKIQLKKISANVMTNEPIKKSVLIELKKIDGFTTLTDTIKEKQKEAAANNGEVMAANNGAVAAEVAANNGVINTDFNFIRQGVTAAQQPAAEVPQQAALGGGRRRTKNAKYYNKRRRSKRRRSKRRRSNKRRA